MDISKCLKSKRAELNMTQEQVSQKIFVSQKSISNWENGKTFPDIDSLIRLAQLYDLSLDNLLLEGSDIVKDIKKKTNLHELQSKLNISLGISTGLCLIVSFGRLSWQVDLGLTIITFFNLVNMFWFSKKIKELQKQKSKINTRGNRIFLIILTLVVVTTGVITFLLLK